MVLKDIYNLYTPSAVISWNIYYFNYLKAFCVGKDKKNTIGKPLLWFRFRCTNRTYDFMGT